MQTAFQKDRDFLDAVRRGIKSGGCHVWWLGQSGFLIVKAGRGLVFDPYLSDSLTKKYAGTNKPHERLTERVVDPAELGALGILDVISSTHNHTDHLDAETLLPLLAANPQARLIIPAANREFVIGRLGGGIESQLVEFDAGISKEVCGLCIQGVAAAHNSIEKDGEGRCKFLGYVVRWGRYTFYHSGDTLRFDGMAELLRPLSVDLAFLPINGNRPERGVAGNLDGEEAAQLAHDMGAKCVVPCHFGMFAFNTESPSGFISECERLGQNHRLLRNGEGMEIS